MNKSEAQAWEQSRINGKSRFILKGIVQRGFKVAAPYTIGFYLTDLMAHRIVNPSSEAVFLVKTYVLLTLLAGWIEGAYIWYKSERDFQKPKKNIRK
jgi:hypothetical protein